MYSTNPLDVPTSIMSLSLNTKRDSFVAILWHIYEVSQSAREEIVWYRVIIDTATLLAFVVRYLLCDPFLYTGKLPRNYLSYFVVDCVKNQPKFL